MLVDAHSKWKQPALSLSIARQTLKDNKQTDNALEQM